MTPTREKELWVRYKARGDESARDELIVAYMPIVKYVAGRMAIHVPSNVELDDLIGWGVLGLMDAVEKFDHEQDIKFSTYATIRIRGAIIDEIRSLDWAPRSLRAMARKIGSARDKLRQETGMDPTYEDIGEELGVSSEHVEDTMSQVQTAHVLSLDDYLPSEDAEEGRKLNVIAGDNSSPESAAAATERQERLVEAILGLPDQQQKVLNLYYYEELTLKEIGAVLEVSESRICQVHSAAIKQLRKIVRSEESKHATAD